MVREAEQHAAEDRKRRELIDARNQADSLIYIVEKDLTEAGDQLSASDRQNVENAVSALRTAMAADDLAVIQQRMSALSDAARRLAEAKQQSAQPESGPPEAPTGDDVVDAEFEEVDEKRRRAS
jgi:molecular chaperone DnaK